MKHDEYYFDLVEDMNVQLTIPSNAMQLSCLPVVKNIVCCNQVFAIEVATMLQQEMFLLGQQANVIIRADFDILSGNVLFSSAWCWFQKKFLELGLPIEETILVASVDVAYWVSKDPLLCKLIVAVEHKFRQPKPWLTSTFLRVEGENRGMMKLRNCDFMVTYGDDMKIIQESGAPWKMLKAFYGEEGPSGQPRRLIHLGGKGIVNKLVYPHLNTQARSAAELQQEVSRKLMFGSETNVVLGNGDNLGADLYQLAQIVGSKSVIVVVPQRMAMLLKFTQQQQFPDMNIKYLVIYESVAESCSYLNGMAFCGCEPILHYWGHVLPRWEEYAQPQSDGKPYMIPVFGVSDELRRQASELSKRFLGKQKSHSPRRWYQMMRYRWALRLKGSLALRDFKKLHLSS